MKNILVPGYVNERGVKLLHVVEPDRFTKAVTLCPKCKRTSMVYMINFQSGRSQCSYGCFKGRRRNPLVTKRGRIGTDKD